MHERPLNVTLYPPAPAILTVPENTSPEPVVAVDGALEGVGVGVGAGVEYGVEDGVGVGVGAGVEDDESL